MGHTCVNILTSLAWYFSARVSRRKPWENCPGWLPEACFCCLPASQHNQPSPHLCNTVSQLVIYGASWIFAGLCFLGGSVGKSHPINTIHAERPKSILLQLITTTCSHSWVTDCYDNCRVRWLGICRDQRHWMGLGWCHLALQHRLLLATGCHQVPHSLCDERESLGSCPRSKGKNMHIVRATFLSGGVYSCFPAWPPNTDRLHEEEGFRTGRTWAQVGDRSEDATWASASRVGHFPWHEQLQRTQPARRRGPQESWNCKVQLGENISPSSGIYISGVICDFSFCCRLRELNTLKGRMESVVRQKGLDLETIQQSYTVWLVI